MKVKELIDILQKLDLNSDVVMQVDRDPDNYGLINIEVNGDGETSSGLIKQNIQGLVVISEYTKNPKYK